MIYLDNAATTKCWNSVQQAIAPYFELYFNPAAMYEGGLLARQSVLQSRMQLAKILGCDHSEIIYTSCATESNNLAIFSGLKNKKATLITSMGEHASVFAVAKEQQNRGINTLFIPLNAQGTVDTNKLYEAIDQNVGLVSLIHVSNETGAVHDIAKITAKIKSINKNTLVHADGVQAFCKGYGTMQELGVDMYTISAHKIGGLKSIGALYIKKGINIRPQILGGGQENNLRSGTTNPMQIAAFSCAANEYARGYCTQKMQELKHIFVNTMSNCTRFKLISDHNCCPSIISFSLAPLRAEIVQTLASEQQLYIGIGSACSQKSSNNRVLQSMGIPKNQIESALRVSFCPQTSAHEVQHAAQILTQIAEKF